MSPSKPNAVEGLIARAERHRRFPVSSTNPRPPMRYAQFVQLLRAHRPWDLLTALGQLACLIQPDGLPVQASPKYWTYAPPWAIAASARDIVLHGTDFRDKEVTTESLVRIFNGWSNLYDVTEESDTQPLTILTRHAFEQFPYQESMFEEVARSQAMLVDGAAQLSCKVITPQSLNELLGAPMDQVLGATFFLYVAALKNDGIFDRAYLDREDLQAMYGYWPRPVIEQRLDTLSSTVEEFRADFNRVNTLPIAQQRWAYNPLVARPFITRDERVALAPQPSLILRTATPAGLFYAGTKRHGAAFANDLGMLTEHYVGRQLQLISGAEIHPEVVHGSSEKKSTDWFIVLDHLVVLVEVKAMRSTMGHRAGLADAAQQIADRLDHAIAQLEGTRTRVTGRDPAFGHIPHDRPVIGIVVTSEGFPMANSPFMREKMRETSFPILVASLREIEHLVCRDSATLEAHLLAVVQDEERNTWSLGSSIPRLEGARNPILQDAFDRLPLPATTQELEGRTSSS